MSFTMSWYVPEMQTAHSIGVLCRPVTIPPLGLIPYTKPKFGDTSYTKPDYQQVRALYTHTNTHTNTRTKCRPNHSENVSRQSRKFHGHSQKFHGLSEKSHGLS